MKNEVVLLIQNPAYPIAATTPNRSVHYRFTSNDYVFMYYALDSDVSPSIMTTDEAAFK